MVVELIKEYYKVYKKVDVPHKLALEYAICDTYNKLQEQNNDNLEMLKLLNKAFKAFPNSPEQNRIKKELNKLRIKNGLKPLPEGWSEKYKKSIDCNNPKGFSQKAHCAGKKKRNEYLYEIVEDLRKWFGKGGAGGTTKGGWDRYGTSGQKLGKCGDAKEGEPYSACLSAEKAKKLGPKGRAAFVKRKRAAQKKAGDSKKGKERKKGQTPTYVKTGA